jgi:hypothetical protein
MCMHACMQQGASACKSACILTCRMSSLLCSLDLASFCAPVYNRFCSACCDFWVPGGGSSGDNIQAPASDPSSSSPNSAQGGTRGPQFGPDAPVPVSPSPAVSPYPSPSPAPSPTVSGPGPSPSNGTAPRPNTTTSPNPNPTPPSPNPTTHPTPADARNSTSSPSPRPTTTPSSSPGPSTGQPVLERNKSSTNSSWGPAVVGGTEGNHLYAMTSCCFAQT